MWRGAHRPMFLTTTRVCKHHQMLAGLANKIAEIACSMGNVPVRFRVVGGFCNSIHTKTANNAETHVRKKNPQTVPQAVRIALRHRFREFSHRVVPFLALRHRCALRAPLLSALGLPQLLQLLQRATGRHVRDHAAGVPPVPGAAPDIAEVGPFQLERVHGRAEKHVAPGPAAKEQLLSGVVVDARSQYAL